MTCSEDENYVENLITFTVTLSCSILHLRRRLLLWFSPIPRHSLPPGSCGVTSSFSFSPSSACLHPYSALCLANGVTQKMLARDISSAAGGYTCVFLCVLPSRLWVIFREVRMLTSVSTCWRSESIYIYSIYQYLRSTIDWSYSAICLSIRQGSRVRHGSSTVRRR